MSFTPPKNTRLRTKADGRTPCTALLGMRGAGFSAEEELEHLAAHARTCEPPSGVEEPFCPCPWCAALRQEYGRQMFRDREVRRFQLFDGDLEVGIDGEYDYVVLQRLIERKGSSWDDAALLEKPFAKGYFVTRASDGGTLAQLSLSTDDRTAAAAQRAFEEWSEGPAEWLPSE